MDNNNATKTLNKKPIYCRDCKQHNTWDSYPEHDVKTEFGQVYMLAWRCSKCGHVVLTSNPDYQPR